MPRQFSIFALVGLAFSITNSWIAIFAAFQQPLNAGGGPGVFYSLLVAFVACSIITVGLAELASAFPTCGGQYHFAFMVSTPNTRAFAAFITGWLSMIAWILCCAASAVYAAQMVAYLAAAYNEGYEPKSWHIWLIYVAIMAGCAAVLCLLPTLIPSFEKGLFITSLVGFVAFMMTVLIAKKAKNPPRMVFSDYHNESGWSDGLGFMISCGTAMYTFIGTDSAIHVSEEVPNPTRLVPMTMCLTMIIGVFTSVPWTLSFLFAGGDLDTLGNSLLPTRQLFLQAMNNPQAATFFTCWYLFIYLGATMGCLAVAGRQTWAFARDNGLPYSSFNAKIHPRSQMPVNATLTCTVVIWIYGIIYVGSTAAFNSFLSASILVMNLSYAIPQGIVLFRNRKEILPNRPFNLGRFGPIANAFSVAWVALYVVLFCFPIQYPTTVQSMNYVSVVVSGCLAIIFSIWFGGKRKTFSGPNIHMADMHMASSSLEGSVEVINGQAVQPGPGAEIDALALPSEPKGKN
ncbi:amino acid/polyamine transporter I [Aspergillus varians]